MSSSGQHQFRYTQTPSKVLHLRNLPWECTEEELVELCKPFGKIVNTKCNVGANRNQAFVEFTDLNQAISMVSYYASSSEPAQVRGKTVYIQYSNRHEIVNNSSPGDVPGNVLLVTIEGVEAGDVSIDVIHLVFSAFGFVHKIATFEKAAGFQALIQYSDTATASSARNALDGRSIPKYLLPEHVDSCHLRISYSAHTDLSIKFQSNRSRDYTNPYLPVNHTAIEGILQPALGPDGKKKEPESNVLLSSIENMQYAVTVDVLHTVFSAFGTVQKIAIFEKNGGMQALVQYPDVTTAAVAKDALEGHCIYDGGYCKLHLSYSRHTDLNVKAHSDRSRDYTIPEGSFLATQAASVLPTVPTVWQSPHAAPPMFPGNEYAPQQWDPAAQGIRQNFVPVPSTFPGQTYPASSSSFPSYATAAALDRLSLSLSLSPIHPVSSSSHHQTLKSQFYPPIYSLAIHTIPNCSTSHTLSMSVKLILFWTFLVLLSHPLNGELFYSGFDDGAQTLILDGGAQIQKSGALRLTNDTSRLIGHAFSSSPARFKDSPNGTAFSFSTCFAFAIVPEYPKLGGHGMAFAISRTRGIPRALPSQYLGLLSGSNAGNSSKQFVAVEFDTVKDIELRDIDDNHVGIDMSSLISNASAPASYFAGERLKGLNLTSGSAILAFIEYDSGKNQLNVTLSPSSAKPNRPTLSFDVDLSPILDEYMYVGFSASTGLLASSHYVLGWSFNVSGEAKSLDLSSLPSLPGPRKSHKTLIAAASVAAVFVVLLLIGIAFYLVRKIKNADVIEAWELEIGPHRFSYQQLKRATRGFKDKELLGFGGFGRVYRGVLPNSKSQVAVKRISHESKQGLREFVSEIASIGRLRHRNLVQLLGWCRRRGDLLLVYDFMPNGSLDKYLFDEPKSILSWEQRFKIIKGVASGLVYLHEEWEQTVIHRDIKAGNVLLDSELNGRLGDFGLAKLYEHGANPSTTKVVGTLGYLAPELTRSGKPTASSDVFAFGALLLEVICGRRPIEPKALPEELVLVDWVWQKWETGAIFEVVDPKLAGEYDEGEVALAVKLGLMCSNNRPSARPTMRQVVRYLQGEAAPPEELAAPVEYDAGKCRGGGGMGFEDYEHSYPTSSFFDKMSTCSSGGGVDVEVASASSPLSGGGDAR